MSGLRMTGFSAAPAPVVSFVGTVKSVPGVLPGRNRNEFVMENTASEKKTCLYDSHVALGAQMSPFGGFIMPIQYTGITDEHNAVRNSVGMFDVSHMGEVFVSGQEAEKFVNHIFTNDIAGIPDGKILYGMMLREDGGTVDDLLVYKLFGKSAYLLVVNASNIAKDVQWIETQAKGFDVKVSDESDSWGEVAVQGPDAEKTLTEVLGLEGVSSLEFYTFRDFEWKGKHLIISRTGYTGEDGFEIYAENAAIVEIWDLLLAAGVKPCGLGCRDTLRFEAGLPLYGHELNDATSPIEASLGMFVKTDKPEFIGREAVARQKAEGVEKKLVGIEIFDKAIPRAGYPVLDENDVQIGEVTTGYHSISLGRSVCMAFIDKAHSALDTPVKIQIRKKIFPGKVVKRRFYTPNYKK